MFPKPKPALAPNTYAYESEPLVKPTGFREYDARWLLEKEINLMGVQALGLGLGTLIHELGVAPQVVTGHDFRAYSASVKTALVSGLMAGGCNVSDIGLALTPMAYFAQFELDAAAKKGTGDVTKQIQETVRAAETAATDAKAAAEKAAADARAAAKTAEEAG